LTEAQLPPLSSEPRCDLGITTVDPSTVVIVMLRDYHPCTRMSRSRLLTDVEVAAALRKHPRTIRRWAAAGRFPGAHKAGRSWRIPERALTRVQRDATRPLSGEQLDVEAAISALRNVGDQLDAGEVLPEFDARRLYRLVRELHEMTYTVGGLLHQRLGPRR
jgi:excisionase family DNA binding protein